MRKSRGSAPRANPDYTRLHSVNVNRVHKRAVCCAELRPRCPHMRRWPHVDGTPWLRRCRIGHSTALRPGIIHGTRRPSRRAGRLPAAPRRPPRRASVINDRARLSVQRDFQRHVHSLSNLLSEKWSQNQYAAAHPASPVFTM